MIAPGVGRPRWFGWGLAGAMVAGLVARLVYIVNVARYLPLVGDGETYHLLARVLADGDGYVRPARAAAHRGARPDR